MRVQGGGQPATVSLSFGEEGPKPCPSLSIVLNEDAKSPFRWVLTVWVRYPEVLSRIGQVKTLAPLSTTIGNRVVALAYAPGAVGWMVEAKPIAPTGEGAPPLSAAVAEINLSYSPCCGALHRPGVEAVEPTGLGEPIADIITGQKDLSSGGSTLILAANPFRRRFTLYNGPGQAGDIALGTSLAVSLTQGRTVPTGGTFETTWRGPIYGIGTAAAPPLQRVAWWAEEG